MAIVWGGYTSRMRVGIDVWTDGYDTWTPSINVYVAVHVQCEPGWNFGDNQTVQLTGSAGTHTWNFYNNLGSGQSRHIGTATIWGQGQNYNGGPWYDFWATLSGNYLGGNSTVFRNFWLPARPKRAPSPPSSAPNWSEVTTQQARLTWGHPNDAGGGTLIEDRLQASRNSNFTDVIHDTTTAGVTRYVTNFAPNTRYWFRAAVRSDVGWSGWSGVSEGVTPDLATPKPTITGIGPDSATGNWGNPTGGGSWAGLEVQIAQDANFTIGVRTHYQNTGKNSHLWTGLAPATRYYLRVRSGNPYGWGSWSAATDFETLSGAKVLVGGVWKDAVAYVRDAGQWKQVKVFKRTNGVWTL